MASLILIIIVAVVATIWVRATRIARDRWVSHLSLPGTWECDVEGGRTVLELSGGPTGGRYVERSDGDGSDERGEWSLHGHVIEFNCTDRTTQCDLRSFDDGSIGIDGPGRARRIYRRRTSNVVPIKTAR